MYSVNTIPKVHHDPHSIMASLLLLLLVESIFMTTIRLLQFPVNYLKGKQDLAGVCKGEENVKELMLPLHSYKNIQDISHRAHPKKSCFLFCMFFIQK